MQLTIDNLSGSGPTDYTGSISSATSVIIKRQLNAPSECSFFFLPDAQGLALPARYARVLVTDMFGAVLFTGYVAATPAMMLVGGGMTGALYQAQVTAISDELLLDSVLSVKSGTTLNQPVSQAMQTLARLSGAASLTLSTQVSPAVVGRYQAAAATKWSQAAGMLASSARSAYRILSGVTTVSSVGAVTHTLSETDGSLQLSGLQASTVKLLANDVTVCGKIEPAAYVSETFQGDGVSKDFQLNSLPFQATASEKLTFNDLFLGSAVNGQVWEWIDSGGRLSVTANGVTCTGGSGRDGETVLNAIHQLELGGSIVLEAGGVLISPGSSGLVLGLYEGSVSLGNCFAAFQVSQTAGATQVAAVINGSVGGSSFQPITGHIYTFRMRIYSPEIERVTQSYYYLDTNGVNSYGGDVVVAPGHLVLEVQDVSSGAPGLAVTLYDGAVSMLPAACSIGLFDSGDLTCSIKTFACTESSPLWVTLTPVGGTPTPQYIGATAQNGVCKLAAGGKITFYTGTIPPAGALITVSYRTRHRAVARRSIPQSANQTGATSAAPATSVWIGTVSEPPAWSSTDCDNAATALLKSSAVASAAWAGAYTGWNVETNGGDVWPGDVLGIDSVSAGINALVVVREVEIEMGSAVPQMVKYVIRFANDWAEELALKLASTVPQDAWLPTVPATGGAPLINLVTMQVVAITGSEIQVNAGVAPPSGGGFEVKRKDWSFGPGQDSDLVLRTPVQNFIIPRLAAVEQYYVRMYDGSTPPNYSQFSAAAFVDIPLSGS
jgi:hypothetical protein